MKKEIKYGYYVEDKAQVFFLESVLPQILKFLDQEEKFIFIKDEEFAKTYLNSAETGRNEFEEFFAEICLIGIDQFKQDVFFLGRDLDDKSMKDHEKRIQEMKRNIQNQLTNFNSLTSEVLDSKIIIFLPIQCTEYWLRYIKELKKTEGQDLSQKYEDLRKKQIKRNLYKGKLWEEKNQLIADLCQDVDIDALSQVSESFGHLVASVQTFLSRLN